MDIDGNFVFSQGLEMKGPGFETCQNLRFGHASVRK